MLNSECAFRHGGWMANPSHGGSAASRVSEESTVRTKTRCMNSMAVAATASGGERGDRCGQRIVAFTFSLAQGSTSSSLVNSTQRVFATLYAPQLPVCLCAGTTWQHRRVPLRALPSVQYGRRWSP